MIIADLKVDFIFSIRYPRVRACIFGWIVSMIFMLLIVVFYWWPTSHAANKLLLEINARQRVIANAEFNEKLSKASAAGEQQILLIDKKLQASMSQADIVKNMALLAHRNNVKIVSEAYEEGKVIDNFLPLVQVLTVQAGYAELRNFIAGLEQLPTFTIAQEAILSRGTNTAVIKAQLNIITYRRDPKYK